MKSIFNPRLFQKLNVLLKNSSLKRDWLSLHTYRSFWKDYLSCSSTNR